MSSLLMATPARKPLPSLPPYGPNAVEVKDLTFSYQQSNHSSGASTTTASAVNGSNQPSCWVLEDLNLRLERGSRCLLIGANGSGKLRLSSPAFVALL
jgi:ABC-type polysaccharide/polyol phosphate transport system ATPase subunit